ncbi:MAG: hypothetical protein KAW84_00290 [Thermoplasmata archaeon]|nr:hypothetical protein [Thermoplasmata archaeon]
MPNLTVRKVSTIVRDYFDEVKRSKFIFDVLSVSYDEGEGWEVLCAVSNVFDEEPRVYSVVVDDESGEIANVSETEET